MVRGESKVTALLLALAVGFVGGMAVCFQGPLASLMSEKIGSLESAFVIHLGGTVAAGMLLLFVSGGGLPQWRSVPWYALASGVLGLFLIFALSYTIPRIGVTGTYAVIISAQLLLGSIFDHFGVFGVEVRPFDLDRALAIGVLGLGVWLVSSR